jgi:hypothetical protein
MKNASRVSISVTQRCSYISPEANQRHRRSSTFSGSPKKNAA